MKTQNNLVYCGSFTTTQTDGNKKLLNYGAPTYSPKQKELYKRAMKGLRAYTPEELYAMNSRKKDRIKYRHIRAQKLLNEFRLRRSAAYLKDRIKTIIPNLKEDSILGQLINDPRINKRKRCKFKDEQLLIEKEDIIQLFIANEILPSNFYSL